MRVIGWQTQGRNESKLRHVGGLGAARRPACTMTRSTPLVPIEVEHHGCDPKDGELCLTRVKPEETLVEARRHSDVQIDVQSWV